VIQCKVTTITTVEQFEELAKTLPDLIACDFETTGLGHPSREQLTHLSIGISEDTAYVVAFVDKILEKVVLDWLVTTEIKQVWHNLTFDGKFIIYHTGRLPKNFEDTMIMARIGTNHCDTKSVGLKYLMGEDYGDWAVSKDIFSIDNILDKKLIQYAGIDACATYKLYKEIKESWE